MKSNSRLFSCTAAEACHFANELPSDHEIEPIDIYKIFITDEVLELIVTETNLYFEETMRTTPGTQRSNNGSQYHQKI